MSRVTVSRLTWVGALLALVLAFGAAACGGDETAGALEGVPPEAREFADQWPAPNGDHANTRVAAGSEISSENVDDLGIAWTARITATGSFGGYASTPIIADGVVYTQDLSSTVRAYDLEDGSLVWERVYDSPNVGPNGVTLGNGKVFGATSDRAFALDAETGEEVWQSERLVRNDNEGIDMAPAVYGGLVYVSTVPGNSRAFYAGNGVGVLWALDAETGEREWTFDTVPRDLWNEELTEINSGGGLWHPPAFDGEGMFIAVANPGPWPGTREHPWGSSRPGPNLYTNSAVRLDPETGELDWHQQVLPHDVYDWDLQLPPIVGTAAGRDVVFVSGKLGHVYAIDRADGEIVWRTSVGRHNGHDDDNQTALAGDLDRMPDFPLTVFPGALGGVETQMALFEGTLYVPVVNLGTVYQSQEEYELQIAEGTGEMVALDAETGEVRWQRDLPTPPYGAATVSNDVVFTTTFDGHLRAFRLDDGETALDLEMPAGTNATVAIAGDTLVTAASYPQGADQVAQIIAYRLGADGAPLEPSPDDGGDEGQDEGGQDEGGAGGDGEQAQGRQVFVESCGSCHVLADANTSGGVGPNLDQVDPDRATVEAQVRNGGGGMPAFEGRLGDAEIEAVSAYVAEAADPAASGGGGSGSGP